VEPDGQPTWFLPKRAAMWGPVAFALAVRVSIYLAMTYAPTKVHGAELGVCLFSVLVAATHAGILYVASRRT